MRAANNNVYYVFSPSRKYCRSNAQRQRVGVRTAVSTDDCLTRHIEQPQKHESAPAQNHTDMKHRLDVQSAHFPVSICRNMRKDELATSYMDTLAERSKAVAQGAIPKGRGFEPHRCHFCTISATGLVTSRLALIQRRNLFAQSVHCSSGR